jgi:hypothetical protein
MGSRLVGEVSSAALPSVDGTPTSGVNSSVFHHVAGVSRFGCYEFFVGQAGGSGPLRKPSGSARRRRLSVR